MKILSTILTLCLFLSNNFLLFAKEFKGAEYRTKEEFTYGRFEVCLKAANRDGMLSSFFTYFDGTPTDPWTSLKWNEIDLEIMGRYNDNIQFNTITPGQVNHVGHLPTPFSPHVDYHIYAFEWTPDYVAWFVDGVEVLKQTGAHIATLSRPQKIMMNVWNPQYENWAGILDPATLPSFTYYDWVSYYSYTPGSGNYGSENNFTLDWTDNFDSFDTARWEKATHTFFGNGCDFIEENAVFQDGKLILCLTNSTNIGYSDLTPPTVLWARANSADRVTVMFSEEVDKVDAENISKYLITASGVSVIGATLNQDLKSVDLTVQGMNLNNSNLLIVYPIKDRAAVPNISNTQAKSMIMSQPLLFPIKINCAGAAALDYLPEASWNQNTEYGSMDGSKRVYDSALQISGTEEDIIYQSEIYSLVGYKVRVPNDNYNIKLMFAENYFDFQGARIFNIYLEQNNVFQNLDIFSQVGKNGALVKEFQNIQVNDGVLEIQFADKIDYASIDGIIITPSTTGLNDLKENELNEFELEQNYPNPFNGVTKIKYSVASPENISVQLFDILGKKIFFKDLGYHSVGAFEFILDTKNLFQSPLSSGIYFYVFSSPQKQETRKLVLLN